MPGHLATWYRRSSSSYTHFHISTHTHRHTPLLFSSSLFVLSTLLLSRFLIFFNPSHALYTGFSPYTERRRSSAPWFEGVSPSINPAYLATSTSQPLVAVLLPRSTKTKLMGGDKVARLSSLPLETFLDRQCHSERVAKMIGALIAQTTNSYRRFERSNSFFVILLCVVIFIINIDIEKVDITV